MLNKRQMIELRNTIVGVLAGGVGGMVAGWVMCKLLGLH
jgi:hypothetical protein